jgi:hypothetical protein
VILPGAIIPTTLCFACDAHRAPIEIGPDGVCAHCHDEFRAVADARPPMDDAAVDALAASLRAEMAADVAGAEAARADRTHVMAPPALPLSCACGGPAVFVVRDAGFCGRCYFGARAVA